MRAANVDSVRIAIPNQLHSRERMVPAEVHAADAWPVRRKISLLNRKCFLRDGKDSTRAKYWNSFDASLGLVCRVTRNDCFLLIVAIVLNVINGHDHFVAVVALLMQETLDHRRDALQWGEGHPHRVCADVGACKPLGVDVCWRFFVKPHPVQGLALKLLASRGVALESDDGCAAGDMLDADRVQQVRDATRRDKFNDGILRDCPGAFLAGASD